MISMKTMKFEMKKITMILMFTSCHSLKSLIIDVFDATRFSFLAISFLNIYAMSVKRTPQFIMKTRRKIFR